MRNDEQISVVGADRFAFPTAVSLNHHKPGIGDRGPYVLGAAPPHHRRTAQSLAVREDVVLSARNHAVDRGSTPPHVSRVVPSDSVTVRRESARHAQTSPRRRRQHRGATPRVPTRETIMVFVALRHGVS